MLPIKIQLFQTKTIDLTAKYFLQAVKEESHFHCKLSGLFVLNISKRPVLLQRFVKELVRKVVKMLPL